MYECLKIDFNHCLYVVWLCATLIVLHNILGLVALSQCCYMEIILGIFVYIKLKFTEVGGRLTHTPSHATLKKNKHKFFLMQS